jgi:hypothetical protein
MPKCVTLAGILDRYHFVDLHSLRYTRKSHQNQNSGPLGNLDKVREDCVQLMTQNQMCSVREDCVQVQLMTQNQMPSFLQI